MPSAGSTGSPASGPPPGSSAAAWRSRRGSGRSGSRAARSWPVQIGPGPLRAYRSLIRSDHSLTYDEAAAMLASGAGPPELVDALRRLDGIARERAAARLERGGVAVETRERSFRLEGGAVVAG